MFDALSYFSCLEADEKTDENTLKAKYREKAKFWHPDQNKSAQALENFQQISKAYEVLKNPKMKTAYVLLSMVYRADDFPAFERLKPYLDANQRENPFIRVFDVEKISGGKIEKEKLVGTYADSLEFLRQTTINNFKKGILSLKFFKTLRHNLKQTNGCSKDQMRLLVHNAAAYFFNDNKTFASLSALQALKFCNSEQKKVLENFLKLLPPVRQKIDSWNEKNLKKVQLTPVYRLFWVLFFVVLIVLGSFFVRGFFAPDEEKINYYQTVRLDSGEKMLDDIVTAKIFNVAVDKTDVNMLYHLKEAKDVMYGPSSRFDVIFKAKRGQTVRVTGYTPDGSWFRIMLDNGEMGFVRKEDLKKGIGREIPEGSQIILKKNL